VDRRAFIRALAGGFVIARTVAVAQPAAKVWTIGYLSVGSERSLGKEALVEGLRALGYVEGQDLRIESRFADNRPDLLPGLASELVQLRVALIVAGDSMAIGPAKEATTKIPIVMTVTGDPVGRGLIASLAHPGGNITGLTNMSPDLEGKRLQLLREALPRLSRLAAIGPKQAENVSDWKEVTVATDALGVKLQRLEVSAPGEFERAFAAATEGRADGLLVLPGPITNFNARLLVRLAAERRLPAMYPLRMYAEIGGLMAYGPNIPDLARRAAGYVDKILKGAKPAELPVEQPNTFEFVINLKTTKALGLTIPQSVLLRADQVIR
jgi:ABC-type uncharacterized transport system substrate-binding protein